MTIPYQNDINLNKNEIQNALWHKLSGAPANPVEGQFYYDTTSKRLKYYNGSSWITVGYSADVLSTARTITFAGDTTGSFTFDGSENKSVDIQVKDNSHYHGASTITHDDTYSVAGGFGTLYQSLISDARACRTAFTPANAVKIEYSTDGGATWTDYGASDSQKRELFAMNRGVSIYIGGNATENENVTTNMQTRVTVSPTDRYAGVNQAYIYLSTTGHSCKVDIERSTVGNKETFTKIRENVTVSGWSGPNIVNFSYGSYGGGSSQTSNYYSYRFTFKISAVGSTQAYIKNKPVVNDIRMYGSNMWSIPNRMSFNDHLYSWDVDQNARFPASVRTSTTPTSNDDLTNKKYVDSLSNSTLSSAKSYTDTKSTETLLDVYPIGATYVSKRNVNPSEYFGGTWVLDRDFRGGELIAYGLAYNTKPGDTVGGGTYKGWSDIFTIANQNVNATNYVLGVLEHTSGTFMVHSKGIVGLVEATLTISGNGNSSCHAVWFGNNKNIIPDGAVQIGSARALKTVGQSGNYGGTSNQYLYEVTAGPNSDISFYINPTFVAYPSAAEFYPGLGGVECSLSVKVYSFKETRYLWRRTS